MRAKRQKDDRRRCVECGKKFRPEPSARQHQKTCSEACRSERRRGLSRERYRASLTTSREAARERKRKSRGRLRKEPERRDAGLPPAVNQLIDAELRRVSGADWLACEWVAKALRRVAKGARLHAMSRTGLEGPRDALSLGKTRETQASAWDKMADVTRRPSRRFLWKYLGMDAIWWAPVTRRSVQRRQLRWIVAA